MKLSSDLLSSSGGYTGAAGYWAGVVPKSSAGSGGRSERKRLVYFLTLLILCRAISLLRIPVILDLFKLVCA